jgi:diguanylate cyclase (GGDEF)-like protein/PAS domain S-box-containing protein
MNISKPRLMRRLLTIVIVGFVLSAAYVSTIVLQRQEALERVGRDNVTWMVSQGLSEYTRLQQRVGEYAIPELGVDAEEVRLRFDIVGNRLKLLQSKSLSEFVNSTPSTIAAVAALEQTLQQARPLLDHLAEPGTPERLLGMLDAIYPKIAKLSADSNLWNSTRLNDYRYQLFSLHWLYTAVTAGLILCGMVFIGLILLHNRLLMRTYTTLQDTTADLHATTNKLEISHTEVQEKNVELLQQNVALRLQDVVLKTQNARFDAALNNMSQGLCLVDAELKLIVSNARFLELFGLAPHEAIQGTPLSALVGPDMLPDAGAAKKAHERTDSEQITAEALGEHSHTLADGRVIFVSYEPMSEGGWVMTFEDVTERRRAQDRIVHMAHHDALTDLPNRLLFWENTEKAIRRASKTGSSFAILYLDLDRFKEVNDTLGHPVGDALLRAVAKRLKSHTAKADLVGRLGGDEFAILHMMDDRSGESAATLAETLLTEINRAYMIEGHEVFVSTSIGIAIALEDGATTAELMKNADLALYRAKENGANVHVRFEPEMLAKLQRRKTLEVELARGLDLEQFQLYYQPLISLRTNQIVCGEALIRWNHPERGLISPAEFIPLAEETGFIDDLGQWVLKRACEDAAQWPDSVRVAVNLSPVQFRAAGLYQHVEETIAASGLPPRRLELEITESVLLQNNSANLSALHRLRGLGLSIALDDFGTGYSSLSYLRSFPFDKIKIDQTFVRDLEKSEDSVAIIQSIATLGKNLRMTTTAEGVETIEQLKIVRNAGCTEAQGYYFSRPVPGTEFLALLRGQNAKVTSAA